MLRLPFLDSTFRIQREILDLQKPEVLKELSDNGIVMTPDESDIFFWIVKIVGPARTPYEKGTFYLSFEAPPKYPYVCTLLTVTSL